MELILFYLFAGLSVLSAIFVIAFRNTLSSACALILTLFGIACLFVLLGAHFLAVLQILVYAGAVMVLFVFIIMLLNLGHEELLRLKLSYSSVLGILFASYFGFLLILKIGMISKPFSPFLSKDYGSVQEVGRLLFSKFLVPFEAISLLLLIAMIGAVVLGRKRA
ncbi:MAG: NADH-quinone oxidoreductase subunit J [Deltaproteobacteria bacterium]|nr:NADH-quinone oxidoreductase subunit J [Deltaproteobacteria bacterium]